MNYGRTGKGANESVCGRCGHIVKASTTMTCSECGSDLREVGILPAQGRQRSPFWRRSLLGGLLLLNCGLCIWFYLAFWTEMIDDLSSDASILHGEIAVRLHVGDTRPASIFAKNSGSQAYLDRNYWPYHGHSRHTVTLSPLSKAYLQLVLAEEREIQIFGRKRAIGWEGNGSVDGESRFEMQATIEPLTGEPRRMTIDALHNLACSYISVAGKRIARQSPPDQHFILEWMRDAGVDTASRAVEAEADGLLKIVLTSAREQGVAYSFDPDKLFEKPVGRLETIVHEGAGLKAGEKYPFASHVGTQASEFGPLFSIRWIGIPLSLLVWAGGSWLILRSCRGRNEKANEMPSEAGKMIAGSRTLTIMFTDIKDYTARSAGESRAGVIKLVRQHRELVEPAVRHRGGRIVKQIGDALLIAFESATDAVLAGVEIQSALALHNRSAPTKRETFELRIGISTGEVALEQNDVFGDPVNLASRVQQLAKPDQVLFSESTLAMIKQQEVRYAELGSFELKGLRDPVRVYFAERLA